MMVWGRESHDLNRCLNMLQGMVCGLLCAPVVNI